MTLAEEQRGSAGGQCSNQHVALGSFLHHARTHSMNLSGTGGGLWMTPAHVGLMHEPDICSERGGLRWLRSETRRQALSIFMRSRANEPPVRLRIAYTAGAS